MLKALFQQLKVHKQRITIPIHTTWRVLLTLVNRLLTDYLLRLNGYSVNTPIIRFRLGYYYSYVTDFFQLTII